MAGLGIGAPIVQVYHEKSFILPDVSRVLACLYEKDVKFETHTASYKSLLRLQASSHAPVPFYDGPTFLEESREICRYIAEKYEHQGYPFLLGKDALERASVEQWLHNEEHAFNPPSRALFCHLAFPLGEEDDDVDIHTRKLEEVLEVYEQRLSDSEFLVGNKFTLADLVHLPNSHYIKASNKFLYLYDSRKNVRRWWDAISDRDSWKKVLRYMKRVEEQNKQEELKKQQQQQQQEDPRTSAGSIRLDSREQIRTEPRTILVPPTDTVSSSFIVPRTKKPVPSDTSPDEILISSSHRTPAADKTSAVQSKETTIFTNPQEAPPTLVRSTPVTSKIHPIPVQSTKHATSPTTAKKPLIIDAAKSSTKDASILEPSSSKNVSSNLDVFDHYPSHTDVYTPYIEPTTQKTSETIDAFSESNIDSGYTEISSISAREEPDQPAASDFYNSDSTGTNVDSRFKESFPYSGHTPPELEPTDTSASKLHTTDVHRRPQVEQWHSATTRLNDLKHDADHLVSTQQGKPRKDVQQYPSQDLEQATSHSVPQEPMSMELVQGREKTARRPYTDQSQDVSSQLEDYASSDQRGALLPSSTQEHGLTPKKQVAAKDAHRRILSRAAYPGGQDTGQDTSKQPRDHGSVPRQGEPQDAREIFDESQAVGSSERFSYTSQSSLPIQDLDGAGHATTPFETRYPGAEDTSKQAKDKISTPWQMTDHDAGDITEETKLSESSSFQVQPSYFERADAPSRKQETIDDTFKETASGDPSFHRDQQSGTWQTTSSSAEQEVNQGGYSVAPPSQTRYQTAPKTRYPIAEDASKQARGTAPTPKKKAVQDDNDTSDESKTADEVSSFQKRYPYDEDDIQVANTASVSRKISPDGDKNIFEETKLPDSTTISAKPMYTQRASFPPPRQAEVKDAKDNGRQSRVTIPESQNMVSRDAQTTRGERKTDTPGEQSSDHLRAIPQSRLPAAKGLSTKKDITNEQTVMPPLLSNEPTSRVQPASESLQVPSHGGLSTKPSTIEKWQRASVPLNDTTSSSGDGEIGMATIDQKLAPMSQRVTPSSEDVNQIAKESGKQRVEPPVQKEAEIPGVQSAPPSFPGASTAHHATSNDKFARQSIIDERVREPTKMPPTPYSAPAHTKRETPDGHEIVDSELISTRDGHISEAAEIRQDQAIVHEDVHDANLSADDVTKDTFKEAKVAESTPSSAKSMYPQQPAPTPRHAEVEDTWDKGTKGREAVPDRQQLLEKWAGTAREQVSDRWKASPPSRQAAAEDVHGATGDTIQYPDGLDTSKKSRGAYEEAEGPGSVKEKTSSIYQKKHQEQAQTIPAGEKADGSIRKHQQASDAPNTYVDKLDASEPARVKTHGDFSAEQPYRKDTTDDQKVAPPLSTRELTSQVQPPSEPSYDAALHRDLSSKPSTIYQWQRSSVPLHDVTSSSGDDEMTKSTVDEKPTPMSQQKYDEQRAEPPVPLEAEISDVQHASPSFPGTPMDDRATIGDKFAMQSVIDQRVGEPTEMQTSSPDAHPASEPTKRETPEGHEIGHLELVSTPGGQISEANVTRDDPATVHEDVYDVHLSTQDVGKDAFKETKVSDSIPSSAQPMHIQKPALTPSRKTQVEETRDTSMQSRDTIPEQQKMVERKTVISGEQLSDPQKEIRPSRQPAAENAPISDTIQSPDILDTPNKSRAAYEEYIGPGSTLPKAQVLDAQDSQLTKGESTVPTTDQRKDWKYAKDDETIMTEEKSLSTERLREMFQESASTAPMTQLTDSEGSNALEKTSSVYHKGPLAAQYSQEEAKAIPADDSVDGSTPEHHESSGTLYTYNEKLSASAPSRADIHDGHSAEEQDTVDDQKVASSLSSKEPASHSHVQTASEPLQRAVPDGDFPIKSFTIDQWQRTAAPIHGVITDSGDDEAAKSSNNDQKTRPMSQEGTPSSQSVNEMAKQPGEQRVEPPVPIVAETSDVGHAAPSLPETARTDVATISDKFTEQSNIDERVGKPKQMQAPITAAHPDSARTLRRTLGSHEAGELVSTPEGQRLEGTKATQDPATIHEDVYDASLSTHDVTSDEKTAADYASGDEVVTGSLHVQQAPRPTSTQAQPTDETHTGDSGKTELAKPTVTNQEATLPAAGPTSVDPQHADIVPAGVAHSEQKSAPPDKGSARATQHPSPVEPIKADSDVSAATYTNAPQMIFRQEARPPAPSKIGIRASDTQGVIEKIQEVTPDNSGTDDSGKPFVPSQEHISHASEAIPGQEEMTFPQGTRVTSDNQLSSADVHEVTPNDQQTVESITPLVSSGKQRSHVRSPLKRGEVDLSGAGMPTTSSMEKQEAEPAAATQAPTSKGLQKSGNIESPRQASTAKTMTPAMKSAEPSDAPEGTEPGPDSPRSIQAPFSTEPTKEDTTVTAADQAKGMKTITPQKAITPVPDTAKPPFPGAQNASRKDLESIPNDGPAASYSPKPASQTQAPAAALDVSPYALSKARSTGQGAKPPTRYQASSPETQLGSSQTQGPTAPAEQKIAVSDENSANASRSIASAEPRGEDTDAATADETSVPPTNVTRQVTSSTPDARDALSSDQESYPDDGQMRNLGSPFIASQEDASLAGRASEGSTPKVHRAVVDEKRTLPSSQAQTSSTGPDSTQIGGDARLSGGSVEKQEAELPSATEAPTSKGLQDSGNIESPRQALTAQTVTPAMKSAAPSYAPEGTEPGPDSSRSIQAPFSTEPTKADTIVAPADPAEDMQTITHQEAITPAPDTAKPPLPGAQDASRKFQESTPDHGPGASYSPKPASPTQAPAATLDVSPYASSKAKSTGQGAKPPAAPSDAPEGTEPGPDSPRSIQAPFSTEPTKEDTTVTAADQAKGMKTITPQKAITPVPDTAKPPFPGAQDASRKDLESIPNDGPAASYSPKPASQTQAPAAALDVSPYALSKARSTGQGAKPPTRYQASSPETQLGSSQTQGPAAPAEQKIAVSDENSANASRSIASAEPRGEDTDAATADETSVPPTNVTRQVTSSTPDARDALSSDQESYPDDGQMRNLDSPFIASQEDASLAGRASEGSTPKVHSAVVDEKRTLPSSQAQTSSTGPDSTQIGGDARLSGAGMPATGSVEKQEAELPAATEAPTSKGLQGSGNIESPRQALTAQTVTAAMKSAEPSYAPEATEPGPDSARSVQAPFSTETTKEDTIVARADPAEDMQTITHQEAITPAPDTAKPPLPGAQDASRKFQESTPDHGPGASYSPKPASPTQAPAATLDVSPYASSKAKSTGQGAKPPTGYLASSPETQLGSSQTQGPAAPAEQKIAVSDENSANASRSIASAEPRGEDTDAATADETSVPPTNVTRQVTSSTPDARDALSSDQESYPDDGQMRNLGSPFIASQEDASLAGRASEGSTPKVHSAVVDEKRTLPSSQAQTSSTGPDSTQIGGDARLSGGSVEKQEAELPSAIEAPTSKGLQDSGNIESPRQALTAQTVTPAMKSAAPSYAPEATEPGPDSARSVQAPFSTETTKADTIVTPADPAEDMQTITHQEAITPAPDTAKPPLPGAQDASRKFQESTPDDGPGASYSPKPASPTQAPAATLDVSPYASSKAKSTGQGAKPPTGYLASSPETQLGSSQTQGPAAPAEQKIAVSDENSANASRSIASAEPRGEDTDAATADETSLPPTNVTRQVTSSTPDARDALSSDQESYPNDGQMRNLGSPFVASQEEASRAGRASEGSTPKVHSAVVDEKRTLPSSQAQTSSTGPDSTQIGGDARLSGAGMPATGSVEKQEAELPAATEAPTSKGLQGSRNIESPRQALTAQTVTAAMKSAEPSYAPEATEPGPDSSRSVQAPFSTETIKEDTIVARSDPAEDMQTITHQEAITPAPDTAKPPLPGAQDASRKFQESTPDDGPGASYSPKPASPTQAPAATLDVSPYASSKAKSTGQGAKPPTGYLASSPETQLGSSQTQGPAAPAEQKIAVSDENSANSSRSFASAEPREEDTDAATADETSVPPTNVTHQVTSSTPDARDALSSDQESYADDGQFRNLGSPFVASQEEASRAGRASEGSTPKVHSAVVDEKRTLPSSQAQTSSTGPDSTQIGGDARLSGAGMPATGSVEKQEAELPAATEAPTSKGLQGSGNIESPRQALTAQTVTAAMKSAEPSYAPEATEPGPDSSRSVQAPFSIETTKEETIVARADPAEDMQTITHQEAITRAPDTAKPPLPGAQDASRKFQESTPDDGPGASYSPKPASPTQAPAATLDVSPYASSKAKSTGQGTKPPTGYLASSPETQLGSSQTQGPAAPAEQKFAVSDENSANSSRSFASAEPREEDTDAATADETSVPPTNVTHQVTSSTPDARDALSSDQESYPDDGQMRNLGSPFIASQEEASLAGRASEGSTPKVHSAVVDEKRTLPSSQAQTSSTGPDSTQIGGDARLSGAGMPATGSVEKQEAELPAATEAPTSKGLQGSGNIESPRQALTAQTVTAAMKSAEPSYAPEATEPGPDSARSVQAPFSTETTKEDTIVAAADQAEDMQTMTHEEAITPAPDTGKPSLPGAQVAPRKFQESTHDDHIDEPPRGSSSEPLEGQTFDPYRTNVDEKTTIFPSSQPNISESASDLAPTLGGDVPSTGEGPAENYSPKPGAQAQLPAATQAVSFDASSTAKSTGEEAKAPTGYIASSQDNQLGSLQTQGEATPAEEKLPVSGMHSVEPSKGASFDVLSNEKTTTTQDQVNTLPNGNLSSNQVVEQPESADSKGLNSERNLEGASTNEESKSQQQVDQFGTQSSRLDDSTDPTKSQPSS